MITNGGNDCLNNQQHFNNITTQVRSKLNAYLKYDELDCFINIFWGVRLKWNIFTNTAFGMMAMDEQNCLPP